MSLALYNTMGRELEEFKPITAGKAGFYGCGPTVYNYAHIGNLRAYVFQDTLKRALLFLGYEVKHVMNVTDIGHLAGDVDTGEDKMVRTAQERGTSVLEIAQFYTDAFFKDTERLNIVRPTVTCKATDHVQEMIDLIKRIEANGHTYMAGGNLYYDVTSLPDYGKLARINLDDLKAGARIDVDENKRSPYDFVLWFTKSKFENQALTWDSPWGRGYPGWHIECSAMSVKYLGEQFDIHTGGIDHIQIHHTNEIAQTEGATGKKWVNYWLHNEFLVMDKGKMSKSSGNFLTLQYVIDQGYDPLDYRFFLLGGHYRSQLTFSWESMESARNARKSLVKQIAKIALDVKKENPDLYRKILALDAKAGNPFDAAVSGLGESAARDYLARFKTAIEQDLNTPRGLSEMQGLVRDQSLEGADILGSLVAMDGVLGLGLAIAADRLLEEESAAAAETDPRLDALVAERAQAKKAKNFARADEIRNLLKAEGILLEDGPEGTTWRRVGGGRA